MTQIPIDDTDGRGTGRDQGSQRSPVDESPVEDQLRRLEAIVQRLESEAVSLDDSISLFEEGVELAVRVRKRLESSEGRIKQIIERSEGLFSLEDFDLE